MVRRLVTARHTDPEKIMHPPVEGSPFHPDTPVRTAHIFPTGPTTGVVITQGTTLTAPRTFPVRLGCEHWITEDGNCRFDCEDTP